MVVIVVVLAMMVGTCTEARCPPADAQFDSAAS